MTGLAVATGVWVSEGRLRTETVTPSVRFHGNASPDGRTIQITRIDQRPRAAWVWQLLLCAWFYPAKILLQVCVADRPRQLVWYGCFAMLATLWVWWRLVAWDQWMCVTTCNKVIGEPVLYLFVPSAFFLYDWRSGRPLDPGWLAGRAGGELLLIYPWAVVWVVIQFLIGWLWI